MTPSGASTEEAVEEKTTDLKTLVSRTRAGLKLAQSQWEGVKKTMQDDSIPIERRVEVALAHRAFSLFWMNVANTAIDRLNQSKEM